MITAGHLAVEINHGQNSNLSISNMAPGEHRVAYQLITADMSGVATADLSMTLFAADAESLFAKNASLTVAYSSPEPAAAIGWSDGICAPNTAFTTHSDGTFSPIATMPSTAESAPRIRIGELTSKRTGPGATGVCIRFDIGLDSTAGNDVQQATGAFSMAYSLTQTSAEVSP